MSTLDVKYFFESSDFFNLASSTSSLIDNVARARARAGARAGLGLPRVLPTPRARARARARE